MGKPTFFRQRVRTEAASVKAKTLLDYLTSFIRSRREVSIDEAGLIAADALRFLNEGLGMRKLGQMEMPVVVNNENAFFRRKRAQQEEKLVWLSIVDDEDAAILGEFGIRAMAIGRMVRIIEEAWSQGGLLDINRLCVLFPTNATAIRDRLDLLWKQGIHLPLAGMSRDKRESTTCFRAVVAIQRYLEGEPLLEVRKRLFLSEVRWRHLWNDFRHAIKLSQNSEASEIADRLALPIEWIEGWLQVWSEFSLSPDAQKLLSQDTLWPWKTTKAFQTSDGFRQLLQERHGFSPAGADDCNLFLHEVAQVFTGKARQEGQIVYIGVSSSQVPGKSLKDSQLEPVVLDYLLFDDWNAVNRDSPKALKWARIQRLSTQAYSQGVALNLPDIAYMLAVSVDSVRSAIKEHPQIVLPTRGRVADMGPTTSHAAKILDLFMYGYTETEIVRRTGHSYESIERYLKDFSKVVYLLEQGLPIPAIRQATGFSKALTKKYADLYRLYRSPDFIFAMSKIRRLAHAQSKPKQHEKGDKKDDDG